MTIAYFPHPLATVAPRDLLLSERLNLRPSDAVLEIGTGSGSSLFRLAPDVAAYHGVDIAVGPVERLRRTLAGAKRPMRDVQLFVTDFCEPHAAAALPRQYDVVFSCDTLEHVRTPAALLANVYAALRPGGRAFLTYPNEHPSRAHGITFFERRSELLAIVEAAGFDATNVKIEELAMATLPSAVLAIGWWMPRTISKRAAHLFRMTRRSDGAPQTFDETDFFRVADRLERWAPMINAYCWSVLKAMDMAGPVYKTSPLGEVIWDKRIVIEAVKQA